MNSSKVHTWWRVLVSLIVCATAVATYWYNTHPKNPIKQRVVHVIEGDGYVTEDQCRSIDENEKADDLRKRFGTPAELPNISVDSWQYPIRSDPDRHCSVKFQDFYGPIRKGARVNSVDLELIAAHY